MTSLSLWRLNEIAYFFLKLITFIIMSISWQFYKLCFNFSVKYVSTFVVIKCSFAYYNLNIFMILYAFSNQQNLGFGFLQSACVCTILYCLKWMNLLLCFHNINCFVKSSGEESNTFFVTDTGVCNLQIPFWSWFVWSLNLLIYKILATFKYPLVSIETKLIFTTL